MAEAKQFNLQEVHTAEVVMRGLSIDNPYISSYGRYVRGGVRVEDLLVDEFTYKEYALSGQKPTVYCIVRTA